MPNNEFMKHYSNVDGKSLFGMEQLPQKGDTLIITKSAKDVLVLYELGFHAVSLQSETSILSIATYRYLKTRFKHIILLMDSDRPGYNSTIKHHDKLECQFCFTCSECKDISDYLLKYGVFKTKRKLKRMLAKSFTQNEVSSYGQNYKLFSK